MVSLPFVQANRRLQCADAPEASTTHNRGIDDKGKVTYRFWTQILFYIICLTTISQGLAHFLPALYLPTFATDLGASQRDGSLLITYFNIVCIIAQPLCGALV